MTRPEAFLLPALLSALACSPSQSEPPPIALPATTPAASLSGAEWSGYRAGGNEPFWKLEFTPTSIRFEDLGGAAAAVQNRVTPRTLANGWRFDASIGDVPFVVDVLRTKCNDSMSGTPFPHTVTVTLKERRWDGCGGSTASLLTGAEWRVIRLESTGVSAERAPTMTFAADSSLTGTGGCNRYRGAWKTAGEGITFGPAAATEMACTEDGVGARETRFFSLLAQITRFDIASDGSLVLYAQGRPAITARRASP